MIATVFDQRAARLFDNGNENIGYAKLKLVVWLKYSLKYNCILSFKTYVTFRMTHSQRWISTWVITWCRKASWSSSDGRRGPCFWLPTSFSIYHMQTGWEHSSIALPVIKLRGVYICLYTVSWSCNSLQVVVTVYSCLLYICLPI